MQGSEFRVSLLADASKWVFPFIQILSDLGHSMAFSLTHLIIGPLVDKDLVLSDVLVCNGRVDVINCGLVREEVGVISDLGQVRVVVITSPTATATTPVWSLSYRSHGHVLHQQTSGNG